MASRIESGRYEVMESRMVLLDDPSAELRIDLVIDTKKIGIMRIYFRNAETDSSKFDMRLENGELLIECTNFNDVLGNGTTTPVVIGHFYEKKIAMHIWSYLLGTGNVRKVEYTIFREL